MKKILVTFLAAMMAISLAACGDNSGNGADSAGGSTSSIKDPLELLTTVWTSYSDEELFPVAGGDMSEENSTMDAPGNFGIADVDALDSSLGFPTASADKIDSAASLMHMMNANTFTCGAYHVKSGENTSELSAALKENIQNRQWMCGFPDKLVVAVVDDYVVAFFGENEIVDTFKTKLQAAYGQAEFVCEEPIA